ncbi:MAG: hypothetical protein COA84_07300 [Robiginitomaculum sp.]|nr:MAG: hypothetical protein COA84_07300 [Robiginitomaculum sp.]
MLSFLNRSKKDAAASAVAAARPKLELSGPILQQSLQQSIAGCEPLGGIERYIEALNLKSTLFKEALLDGKHETMTAETFGGLCVFMSTVRRRVAPYLEGEAFAVMKAAIGDLLTGREDTSTADARIAEFCNAFPVDKKHRWVRDLAAEILHNVDPERYPLMTRWMWDVKANTGFLREVWFDDQIDHMTLKVPDTYLTFITLREELSQYLTENGIFRDVLTYIDLLCAQIYADYICAQGGSYLRTDFSSPQDPMEYTRRLLGLDGIKAKTNKTRLKSIDGTAFVLDDANLLEQN